MTELEKIESWLQGYPGAEALQELRIDYYDPKGDNSIGPAGLTEVSRTEDLCGNLTVENRCSFGLFYTLAADSPAANAQWMLEFQKWVQQQSRQHLAPTFGDLPLKERISVGNGALHSAAEDAAVTYMLQLTIYYQNYYENKGEI